MSLFRSGIRSPLVGLESFVRSSGVSGRLVSIVTMMSWLVVRSIVMVMVVGFSLSFSLVCSSICGRGFLLMVMVLP